MTDIVLPLLLLWHVGSVVLWLGSAATFVIGVSPVVRRMSPEARVSFLLSFLPRFSKLIGAASISAVFAGTILLGYVGSVDTSYMPGGAGFIFLSIGAVLGIVAVTLTLGVILPMGSRFIRQHAPEAPNPEPQNPRVSADELAAFKVISSVMSAVFVILAFTLLFMVLGVYI